MNRFISIIVFISVLFTSNNFIKPAYYLKASGLVTDFVIDGSILYAATDKGVVDVFNTKTKRRQNTIKVPLIKDFFGNQKAPKIYSIDKLRDKKGILLTSQGVDGFRDIYICTEQQIIKIINSKTDRFLIKKARFVDNQNILLGLLSNELILYNITKKSIVYRKQLSTSSFSDFCLNKTRTQVASTDEGGVVHLLEVGKGNRIKKFSGNNVDNIYQIDFKNDVIICGGQDRRVAVYHINSDIQYYLNSNFLIYSVGLSPSGKYGGYVATEDNEIYVFDIATKQKLHTLKGQKSTLTKIFFVNDNELITSSEDEYIMFWKLK
jgi:WD40 repeat protein